MDGIADPRATIPLASMPGAGTPPAAATGADFALLLRAALGMTTEAAKIVAAHDATNEATSPMANTPAAPMVAMPVPVERIATQASLAMPIAAQRNDAEPNTAPRDAPEAGGVEQVRAEAGAASQPFLVALAPAWVPSIAPAPNMPASAERSAAMPSVAVATPMPASDAPMSMPAAAIPRLAAQEAITPPDTVTAVETAARPMAPVVARGLPDAPPLHPAAAPEAAMATEILAPFRQAIPSIRQFITPAVATPVAATTVARDAVAMDAAPVPNQPVMTARGIRVLPGVSGFGPHAAMIATSPASSGQVIPSIPQFAAPAIAVPAAAPHVVPAAIDAPPAPSDPPVPKFNPVAPARGEAAAQSVAAEWPGHDMALTATTHEPAAEPRGTQVLHERTADPAIAPPALHAPATAPVAADAPPPARAAAPPPIRQLGELAFAAAAAGADGGTLSVTLDPGALGRVEIRVERQGEAMVVQVLAERPETLLLLQRDARELDRMLGLAADGNDSRALSFGLSSQSGGQNFGGQDQRRRASPPRASLAFADDRPAPRALLSLIDIAI